MATRKCVSPDGDAVALQLIDSDAAAEADGDALDVADTLAAADGDGETEALTLWLACALAVGETDGSAIGSSSMTNVHHNHRREPHTLIITCTL